MTDLVFELSRKEARIREIQAENAGLRAENEHLLHLAQSRRDAWTKAEIARLQAALSDQEAKTALTRVALEYHRAAEGRLAEALERIVEASRGKGYAGQIAETALLALEPTALLALEPTTLATEPLDEDAP